MKFFAFVAPFLIVHAAAAEATNGQSHSCACEAEELGFSIDCSADGVMLEALSELQAAGCANDCTSTTCVKNWYIVQSHHDYCPEAALPVVSRFEQSGSFRLLRHECHCSERRVKMIDCLFKLLLLLSLNRLFLYSSLYLPPPPTPLQEVEDGFHDHDTVCESCEISRQPVDDVVDCPVAVCDDNSGNLAFTSMVSDNCLSNGCNPDLCKDNYFVLLSVHDNCPHDVLSRDAEDGFHDVETACGAAGVHCNSGGSIDQNLVCDDHDHDHDDEDKELSGATRATWLVDFLAVGIVAAAVVTVPTLHK